MEKETKKEKEITTEKTELVPQWAKDLQEKVEKLSKENEMLKDMAGKNAITSYEDGKRPAEAKTAHFKVWEGKIVLGWDTLDYSHFNPSAPDGLRENILTNLILEDGEKKQVNYVLFNNSTEVKHLEIVNKVGDLTTVLLPSGKEVTVETKFLNR